MKICVYAISKNEAQFVRRFCESAKDADLVVVADTGSTDTTVEELREVNCGHVQIEHISIKPWRFDHARNAALALIPDDIDVCVSLDLDEVLQPGWREEIERVWKVGETNRLRYMFEWGCGIAFWYVKIHARHGFFWHHPCHEYPVNDKRVPEVWAKTSPDFLMVVHKPDSTKSRAQYLDLLKLSVDEDPDEPHNAFYYARELSFVGRYDDSIAECKRYMTLPLADWNNERCYAYRTMARCYIALTQWWEAECALMDAIKAAPNTREPWCEMAGLMYRRGRWSECYSYALRCLEITNREAVYTVDPEVWGHTPHTWVTIAAWNMGLKDVAHQHAALALALAPEDAMVVNNHKMTMDVI